MKRQIKWSLLRFRRILQAILHRFNPLCGHLKNYCHHHKYNLCRSSTSAPTTVSTSSRNSSNATTACEYQGIHQKQPQHLNILMQMENPFVVLLSNFKQQTLNLFDLVEGTISVAFVNKQFL